MKKIKVRYRKLGRERAHGQAHENGMIELDTRLRGKKHCEILLHEALHLLFPDLSETAVIENSKQLSNLMWSEKYRRIDDKKR